MDPLHIVVTKSTPEIIFSPTKHTLSIKGQSYPENAFKFYEPIFVWLDQYLAHVSNNEPIQVEFQFPYINTSSSKCIMMILEKLETAYYAGKKVKLDWLYDNDNESELECAQEFKEDFTFPIQLISLEV